MNLTFLAHACLVISLLFFTGCSSIRNMIPNNWGKEQGWAWCSERYLDMVTEYQNPPSAGSKFAKKIELSERGYLYVLTAAYSMQKPGDTKYRFKLPPSIESVTSLARDNPNGFQANTFLYTDPNTGLKTTIIAFRGSDQWIDWWKHNLSFWPSQFDTARKYVTDVHAASETQNSNLVVTGFSLGGGLAVHVTKHPETSKLISSAWAFNPSPRTGVSSAKDNRIYMLAVKDEVLGLLRRSSIGAVPANTSEDFDLIASSSWYAHSQWLLTRQILLYADLSLFYKNGRHDTTTAPLKILKKSRFEGCRLKDMENIKSARERYHPPS
jgi:hypothetical protein